MELALSFCLYVGFRDCHGFELMLLPAEFSCWSFDMFFMNFLRMCGSVCDCEQRSVGPLKSLEEGSDLLEV